MMMLLVRFGLIGHFSTHFVVPLQRLSCSIGPYSEHENSPETQLQITVLTPR
jgi:hypothetical protein